MTDAYSGIEQVCSELEIKEEETSIINEREAIEKLAAIYMHYELGNRWKRIKLFTMLQPEFKEILFSCKFSDHIRNLSKTRNGISNVIALSNFKIYMKEGCNTIVLSQEPYLSNFEGFNCFIEKKLLRMTKLSYLKDTHMVPILKFKNRIIYVPLSKVVRKYGYETPSVLVRIYTLRSQVVSLFHNYLIDVEYLQIFLCRFIRKYQYLEIKIQYDKIDVDVKANEGQIKLIHETFGDAIRINRPRMNSTTKDFDQQIMLGLEYLSCSETEDEKNVSEFS
jgi:hypothetical protein